MKRLTSIAGLGVLALLSSTVSTALSVTATSDNYNPVVGQQFTVTLHATDVVNSGGWTVRWVWDTSKAAFATPLVGITCPACRPATGPAGVSSGTDIIIKTPHPRVFDVFPPGGVGVSGDFDFAVFTFNAIAAGPVNLVFSDDGGNESGWFAAVTADWIPASYENALITVQAVPAPPAALLLLTGIAGLSGRRWLRRNATS